MNNPAICIYLLILLIFFLPLHSSLPFVVAALSFPCYICLCLAGEGEGWKPERGIIEVLASVYVCVWVSISLFPHSHNSFSFFTKPLLPLPHLSTIQDGPGWTCLPFTLPPMSCCLTVHLPTPVSHLCLCCSLTLGMVCLDSEETENLSGGRSSEAGKKSSPVVWHKLFGFSITERWNPDVWASFIRKKVLPNGHKPIQNVTWWSLPSLFYRTFHTMSQLLR